MGSKQDHHRENSSSSYRASPDSCTVGFVETASRVYGSHGVPRCGESISLAWLCTVASRETRNRLEWLAQILGV